MSWQHINNIYYILLLLGSCFRFLQWNFVHNTIVNIFCIFVYGYCVYNLMFKHFCMFFAYITFVVCFYGINKNNLYNDNWSTHIKIKLIKNKLY